MVLERQSRNLDVLRAIAVSSVFLGHAVITVIGRVGYVTGSAARFGVMAFFVHTALVLMRSLERLDTDGGGNLALRFYIRRIFRIYPLSIFCVLSAIAFHIPTMPWRTFAMPTGRVVASNLLLMQNLIDAPSVISPLWSLPFEVQMYLALPLCYVAVRRWAVPPLWLAAAAAVACVPAMPVYVRELIRYFPCFLVGVAAYKLSDSRKGRYPAALLILLLLITCVLYAFGRTYFLKHSAQWRFAVYACDWLCSLVIGLALPYFREIREGWISTAAHRIATYSYGIYLSHIPIMWVAYVAMRGKPTVLRLTVFLIGSVAVPILAFHLLENPGIHLGKQISKRLRRSHRVAIPQAA